MTDKSGFYKGRHFTTYVEEVKAFKRAGDLRGAEALLLALVQATENEARMNKWAVAPWYYDQLAIIYRKTKTPEEELGILERYAARWPAENGPLPAVTLAAIEKARMRVGKVASAKPAAAARPAPARRLLVACASCGFEHRALARCPHCGAPRWTL